MVPGADPAGIFAHAASVLPLGGWRRLLQQIRLGNVVLHRQERGGVTSLSRISASPRQSSRVDTNNRNGGGTDACIKQIYG